MTAPRCSPHLLARARVVQSGTCVLCGCIDALACPGGCAWEDGTSERLCTAHGDVELVQARAALRLADTERHRQSTP